MYQYLGNTGISMYDLLNTLTIIPILIFNFCQFNKKKELLGSFTISVLERKQKNSSPLFLNLAVTLEILIVTIFQYAFTGQTNSLFGELFDTGPNYFGLLYINPILVAIICFVLGIDFLKQMDLFTPGFPLALILAKLACFCYGCCEGLPCSFGLYNHCNDRVEFPAQLVEVAIALLLFIFLMLYRKKAKEGTMFPIYLTLYSSTRFLCQFIRSDHNIVWIFDKYHFLCFAGIVIGLIELFAVKKYSDNIKLVFDKLPEIILKKSREIFKVVCQKTRQCALKLGIIKEKKIIYSQKNKKRKKNIKKIKNRTRKKK